MNYANYEDSIVQGRRVKIVGWPSNVAFASPSSIGNLKDMRTLHDGWLAGSIRWIRMTSADVKEHAQDLQRRRDEGETIGKKRKQRSTKTKKKGPTSNRSDDESSDGDGNKENNTPTTSTMSKRAKRAKQTPKLQMAPKSKAVISDSEEDMDGGVVNEGGASAGQIRMLGDSASPWVE